MRSALGPDKRGPRFRQVGWVAARISVPPQAQAPLKLLALRCTETRALSKDVELWNGKV